MLIMCPHCGHHLPQPLIDGMSSCLNCQRTFDSSRRNLILATAWVIRRKNVSGVEYLADHFGLSIDDAEFVSRVVDDECCSHEEFLVLLDERVGKVLKKKT